MPESDQRDAYSELFDAILRIADYPPRKGGTNVHAALVPWSYIKELRRCLDAVGIEWHR